MVDGMSTKNSFKGWVWAERRWLPFVNVEHNSEGSLAFTFGVKNPKIMVLPESTKIKWRTADKPMR